MPSAELLDWLHLLATAAYFGTQFAVLYMLLPAAEQAGDEQRRRAALIAGFKFYDPFSIAMLGVVVITGAIRLTDLKAELKFDYFSRLWAPLSLKLLLAFLLIFLQTYVTFGLAFRIGRQEEVAAHGDGEPFTVEQVDRILLRIRSIIWVTIVLTAAIVLVSLTLVRRAAEGTVTGAADSTYLAGRLSAAADPQTIKRRRGHCGLPTGKPGRSNAVFRVLLRPSVCSDGLLTLAPPKGSDYG